MRTLYLLLLSLVCSLICHGNAVAADDVIIISAEQIAALHPQTLADVLNTVSGISASDTSVSIHGNSKVKVFVDGRPLNDPTSSCGGVKLDLVTPDEVEQIEILRGKGGVRYGQDASGGVILITSRSRTEFSGQVKTYAGSDGQLYAHSNLQASSGAWSSALSGGYETTDGFKVNNDSERKKGGAKLTYQPTEKVDITLSGDYLIYSSGLSGYPAYPTPHSRQQSHMGAYSLAARYDTILSKTYFNRGCKHNWDDSRDQNSKIRVDEFGQELSHAWDTGSYGTLDYGSAFFFNQARGSAFTKENEHTLSAFALQSIPFDKWNLAVGLRASHYSAFGDTINPEIKLSYDAGSWQTSLGYSRTDNTPSFYKRYNQTSSTDPNPDLGMETADNFSLVLTRTFTDQLRGGATLFYNLLSDRISYIRTAGIGQYQNLGKVSYRGGDLSLTWTPVKQLSLRTNYTYMQAKDEDTGLYVSCKPRHKGRLDLNWQPLEQIHTVFSLYGNSWAYATSDNKEKCAGYLLADLRTEYSIDRYTLFAEVTNITDKRYLYVDGLLAPPRQWFAGIMAKF